MTADANVTYLKQIQPETQLYIAHVTNENVTFVGINPTRKTEMKVLAEEPYKLEEVPDMAYHAMVQNRIQDHVTGVLYDYALADIGTAKTLQDRDKKREFYSNLCCMTCDESRCFEKVGKLTLNL